MLQLKTIVVYLLDGKKIKKKGLDYRPSPAFSQKKAKPANTMYLTMQTFRMQAAVSVFGL